VPSIFLSHNSADKPFVRKLAERLTESGATVWLDEAQLQIGDSLVDKISEAIHTVDFVAAVISSNSIRSKWVKKELSLALSKEMRRDSVVVLPVVIDDCELPPTLADKLYADFRDPTKFDQSAVKLLRAMGLRLDRKDYRSGIAIEWTNEGPRIFGHGVVISPSEGNALLDRWSEWLPKFVKQEEKRGRPREEVVPAANVLAVVRACFNAYNRVPDETEMQAGTTELARKFDLLFLFFQEMFQEAASASE
jgi:hypothetical protein